jgi:hypothetical protein
LAFARHQFAISQPQDDGSPLLAHLEAAWRASGKQPQMLADAPTLPDCCETLWLDFIELHGSRGSTGFGAARITYSDLHAYQQVTGLRIQPWQLACIRKADDMWLADFAPKPKTVS